MRPLADARAPIDREAIHRLVDQLLDLRERSAQANCQDPTKLQLREPPPASILCDDGVERPIDGQNVKVTWREGKDSAASWALYMALDLAVGLAGWAVNHRVGRALRPGGPPDEHSYESEGADAAGFGNDFEPEAARAVVLDLLNAGLDRMLPESLSVDLKRAFEALDLGEVTPLVSPKASGRRGRPFSLIEAKLKIVELIDFRIGHGEKSGKAMEAVAEAISVSVKTIEAWISSDLPNTVGAERFSRLRTNAQTAGKYAAARERDPDGWEVSESPVDFVCKLMSQALVRTTEDDLRAMLNAARANDRGA